jgi:TPR repeat protein
VLDFPRAIRLLVEAAQEGSTDAMCALGIASEEIGDIQEAKIWFHNNI